MFYDLLARTRMNIELMEQEARLPPMGRAERKALRRAKEAERAFRAFRGYPPDTFWGRLRQRLFQKR